MGEGYEQGRSLHQAQGFRSGVTPGLGKGLGHSTIGPNSDKEIGFLPLNVVCFAGKKSSRGSCSRDFPGNPKGGGSGTGRRGQSPATT